MKIPILTGFFLLITIAGFSQGTAYNAAYNTDKNKGKAVKYNGFGMGILPAEHLMIGGNHITYRKIGFGISWRAGIRNYQRNKEGFSDVNFDSALANGWLTGNTQSYYSYAGALNFVIPITKKIPLYLSAGAVRHRVFSEIQAPFFNPGETEWQINSDRTQFEFNFGGGIFLPIYRRFVLNLGYDHNPQTLFLGFTIQDPFNYEDIDMW